MKLKIKKLISIVFLTVLFVYLTMSYLHTFAQIIIGPPDLSPPSFRTDPINRPHLSPLRPWGADVIDRDTPVVDLIDRDPRLMRFRELIYATEIKDILITEGPFTVFVPVNDAFYRFPDESNLALLREENGDRLRDLVMYHVIRGRDIMPAELQNMTAITTMHGDSIDIRTVEGRVFVGNAEVTGYYMQGSNGVVYIIDTILFPGYSNRTLESFLHPVDTARARRVPLNRY
jgi:uncharacterized surface protein with fasciclin (FAS1) repeats